MRSRDSFERCDHVVPCGCFCQKRLGFTIIDLLVSLAIVMLMLATVAPALKHAKLVSLRTVCMVHEHEQGQFIERYAQDKRGYFPPFQYALSVASDSLVLGTTTRSFADTGLDYFDAANLTCPLDSFMGEVKYTESNQVKGMPMSFAFNIDLLVQQSRIHFLPNASEIVTMYDGSMSGQTDGGYNIEGYYEGSYDAIEYARMNRHIRMSNVLYLDGHVETQIRFMPSDIAPLGNTFVAATWAAAQGTNSNNGNSGGNGNGNNGHGNNDDGVDSSNPGQGNGGPNGGDDPSGGVDDESKGGGSAGNNGNRNGTDTSSTDNTTTDTTSTDTTTSSDDTGKNNNGHGNNEDGVDSSNPGKGKGGPNGQDDPSGTVDDESKGGGSSNGNGNGNGKDK